MFDLVPGTGPISTQPENQSGSEIELYDRNHERSPSSTCAYPKMTEGHDIGIKSVAVEASKFDFLGSSIC